MSNYWRVLCQLQKEVDNSIVYLWVPIELAKPGKYLAVLQDNGSWATFLVKKRGPSIDKETLTKITKK